MKPGPEDLRKLVAGYATGTLSEAERAALFAAALEDQSLFDELMREEPLRAALDMPGARERLIAAAAPPAAPGLAERVWRWWLRPIPVAGLGAVAAAAILVVAISSRRPETPAKWNEVAVSPPAPEVRSAPAESAPARQPEPASLGKLPPAARQSARLEPAAPAPPQAQPPPAVERKDAAAQEMVYRDTPKEERENVRVSAAAPSLAAPAVADEAVAVPAGATALGGARPATAFRYAVRTEGTARRLEIAPERGGFFYARARMPGGVTEALPLEGAAGPRVEAGGRYTVALPGPGTEARLTLVFAESPEAEADLAAPAGNTFRSAIEKRQSYRPAQARTVRAEPSSETAPAPRAAPPAGVLVAVPSAGARTVVELDLR